MAKAETVTLTIIRVEFTAKEFAEVLDALEFYGIHAGIDDDTAEHIKTMYHNLLE